MAEATASLAIDPSLDIGREFESYNDLQLVIEERKKLFGERWKISDSASVVRRNQLIEKSELHLPEHLKYYTVYYRCIHEGARRVKKNQGPPKKCKS